MKLDYQFKYVAKSLKMSSELGKKKKLRIQAPGINLNNQFIELWKSGNKFEFLIEKCSFQVSSDYSSIFDTCRLTNINKIYSFLPNSYLSGEFSPNSDQTTGELTSFIESSNKNELSFIRFIQPISEVSKIGHIDFTSRLKTDLDGIIYGGGIIHITVNKTTIDVFRIEADGKKYFIIDSKSPIRTEIFEKITNSFFSVYAFLFGDYVGDESYYIFSNNASFREVTQTIFQTKPNTFSENYPVFNRRIPSQNKLIFFPKTVLEIMCQNYINFEKYSRTFEIINEALQTSLPLTKCILFSAALETIVSLINKGKKMDKPINEKHLEEGNLIEEIHKKINDDKHLSQPEKIFLIDKKTSLNKLNEIPNKEKILASFKNYKVKLPESYEKVLNYRNYYLHGSIPEKKKYRFGFNIDNLTKAYELQFLVSILVLKYSGYSGFIQNKSAIMDYHAYKKNDSTKIKLRQAIYCSI